jgi:hypothetical protein
MSYTVSIYPDEYAHGLMYRPVTLEVTENTSIRKINAFFRKYDDSHLYPIFNSFNATNRAIRRLAKYRRDYGTESPEWYAMALEKEISDIVNNCI